MESVQRAIYLAAVAGLLAIQGCSEPPPQTVPVTAERASPTDPMAVSRGGVRFIEGYEAGGRQARRENRPMLVFFTAEWCQFCHLMEQDAFLHQEVVAKSQQFVCVLVDADREPEVCRQFEINGYPTIQFLTAGGVPLNRLVGRRDATQLLAQMDAALDAAALRAQRIDDRKLR